MLNKTDTTADSFSFRRVADIMKLMFPRLRGVMAAFLAVGIIATGLAILAGHWPKMFFSILPLIVFIPALLFYIAPIFSTNAMTAASLTALPATPGEKLTALSAYGLIILPLLCYFVFQLAVSIISIHSGFNGNPGVLEYVTQMSPILMVLNFLSSFLTPIVCQYAAICRPGKRLFPAAMGLLVPVSQGLVGGIVGVVFSFRKFMQDSVLYSSPADVEELTTALLNDIMPWVWAINIICLALCILFLCLSYRRLRARQV